MLIITTARSINIQLKELEQRATSKTKEASSYKTDKEATAERKRAKRHSKITT